MLSGYNLKVCSQQGDMFKYAHLALNLDLNDFINKFLPSDTANYMDLPKNPEQWQGFRYNLDGLFKEEHISVKRTINYLPSDAVYWVGYILRYWVFYKNIRSRELHNILFARLNSMDNILIDSYDAFHTLSVEMAIDDLGVIIGRKG